MKHIRLPYIFIVSLLLSGAILITGLVLSGCAANDPTVLADTAAIKSLQAQIAASTQPAEIPALEAQLSSLQAKEQADVAAAQAKVSAQIAAAQGTVGTVGTVAASTGTPWGAIVAGVLGVVSVGLGAYAKNQSGKAQAAGAVIAAAAPGVAQLVKQTTDNQTLANDITNIGQVAPGVLNLLAHPAAAPAVAAMAANTGPSIAAVPPPPPPVPAPLLAPGPGGAQPPPPVVVVPPKAA